MDINSEFQIPKINLEDYFYELPEGRIAEYPLAERQLSKLLVADARSGAVEHDNFTNISRHLPDGALLVVNRSKVIPARIVTAKPTGGRVEILCVEPVAPSVDPQVIYKTTGETVWKAIIGGKKVLAGMSFPLRLEANGKAFTLKAEIKEKTGNIALVGFTPDDPEIDFGTALGAIGKLPLPPYIKHEPTEMDYERYQTVYSLERGSVAAPTAGLHFTDSILGELQARGIKRCELVLHVGPGTFKPIDTERIDDFDMHGERIFLTRSQLSQIVEHCESGTGPIVAVGTTSMRTLESAYWLGVSIVENRGYALDGRFDLPQWEPYRQRAEYPTAESAFKAILEYMNSEGIEELPGITHLLIVPGYRFRVAKVLITNFHIPESTLILLVAAFVGKELWRQVYTEAIENDYRFLSYGDSSILFRED